MLFFLPSLADFKESHSCKLNDRLWCKRLRWHVGMCHLHVSDPRFAMIVDYNLLSLQFSVHDEQLQLQDHPVFQGKTFYLHCSLVTGQELFSNSFMLQMHYNICCIIIAGGMALFRSHRGLQCDSPTGAFHNLQLAIFSYHKYNWDSRPTL